MKRVENNSMSILEDIDMPIKDFLSLRKLVHQECGITLNDDKRIMLKSRLSKRLRILKLNSFEEYFNILISGVEKEKEIASFISAVTTNKTEFFRESKSLEFLKKCVLPQIFETGKKSDTIKVWSAGCSTGEEPYTLSMIFAEYLSNKKTDFFILGTDVDAKVLEISKRAVYNSDSIVSVPLSMKVKYLMRGKLQMKKLYKIVPELRKHVVFQRHNLMDDRFGFGFSPNIIFCRNVMIYFDMDTQKKLVRKFHTVLASGGFLFIGHSETLSGMNDQFVSVAPMIYQKV